MTLVSLWLYFCSLEEEKIIVSHPTLLALSLQGRSPHRQHMCQPLAQCAICVLCTLCHWRPQPADTCVALSCTNT